ncbi:MAG TPA: hypothetical protein VLC91_12385 [Spongiibacteraceae bacterium]|nr:hypothetical protein [Spongiibacteraceae bacterium]
MKKLRYGLLALCLSLGVADAASARADVSINLSILPDLVPLPGYPVYYAPSVEANFFFYDGMYWLYEDDTWYASNWYNGPWDYVDPEAVPLFVLRIPVRYYRRPPPYFRDWHADAPPRWGYYWGPQWEQRRGGWDHWDHRHVPARAPLPVYQRPYSGDHYPRRDEQPQIRDRDYHYQSHSSGQPHANGPSPAHEQPHANEPRDHTPPQPPGMRGPQQRDYQREPSNINRHDNRHDDNERPHAQAPTQDQRDHQPTQRPPNNRPDAADNRDAQYQRRGPVNHEPQQRPPEAQNHGGDRDNRAQGSPHDQAQGRDRNGRDDRNGQ